MALAERDEEQEGEQVEPWLRAPKPGGRYQRPRSQSKNLHVKGRNEGLIA